jgi:4-alpha-glucanotransferase
MIDAALIERLARLRGIGDAYHDYRGELRHFRLETKAALLRAMGCAVDDPAALSIELSEAEIARWRTFLPKVAAARGPRIGVDLNIPARDFGATLEWSVALETGGTRAGFVSTADCPELWRGEVEGVWITRRRLELPLELEPGYHDLEVRIGPSTFGPCRLILSPPECYQPSQVRAAGRLWGMAVQLYTLRSRSNWGIGDFDDLKRLLRWLAPHGAAFIGLNPLHALAPADPERASPYSASNRRFLNVLYIAVAAVPELLECPEARARIAAPEFRERLAALRVVRRVDYTGVAAAKLEILALLHREFRERHLERHTERARSFRRFLAAGGVPLERHALFDALDEHCRSMRGSASGWTNWPLEFRDVDDPQVLEFAREHAPRIEFFLYLQWLAHEQLESAQRLARDLGMPIGLYGDYAVGAHPSGSETWADRSGYRMGAEIGAPPDLLALKGQGWGIPPFDPMILEERRLSSFIDLVRSNMRYYGALRLDHVMSLFRLWWVAVGTSPSEGAYVHYPLDQLLGALALESVRHRCVVIGEDLGVVPDEMRRAMPQFGIYHYKVLLFEKQHGRFRRPHEFVRSALATVTTHDMPPVRSWWEGLDIDLRHDLGVYPSAEVESEMRRQRDTDRAALLAALAAEGLAPAQPRTPSEPFTPELAAVLHVYLARSATALVAVQIEDLLGMTEPVNVPGTDREYPNWQRKLTQDLEDIAARRDLGDQFAAIARARAAPAP